MLWLRFRFFLYFHNCVQHNIQQALWFLVLRFGELFIDWSFWIRSFSFDGWDKCGRSRSCSLQMLLRNSWKSSLKFLRCDNTYFNHSHLFILHNLSLSVLFANLRLIVFYWCLRYFIDAGFMRNLFESGKGMDNGSF